MLKTLKTATSVLGGLKKAATFIKSLRKFVLYYEAACDILDYTINRIQAVEKPELLETNKKAE